MSKQERIKSFLALPTTSLPSAYYTSDDEGDAWAQIRDYVRSEEKQRINHMGETILLKADADGWREGHEITMS